MFILFEQPLRLNKISPHDRPYNFANDIIIYLALANAPDIST